MNAAAFLIAQLAWIGFVGLSVVLVIVAVALVVDAGWSLWRRRTQEADTDRAWREWIKGW